MFIFNTLLKCMVEMHIKFPTHNVSLWRKAKKKLIDCPLIIHITLMDNVSVMKYIEESFKINQKALK